MLEKLGLYAIILVVVVGVVGYFIATSKIRSLEERLSQAEANSGSLPEDVCTDIELKRHLMSWRERVGIDSVVVREEFIPPESSVEVVVEKDTVAFERMEKLYQQIDELQSEEPTSEVEEQLDSLQIELDDLSFQLYSTHLEYDSRGFCLEPAIGSSYSTSNDLGVDGGVRIGYIDRYGIGLQVSLKNPAGLFEGEAEGSLGGYCDARVPNWNNLGIKLGGEYNFTRQGWYAFAGLNFYLK